MASFHLERLEFRIRTFAHHRQQRALLLYYIEIGPFFLSNREKDIVGFVAIMV
jgi:hypothetical protein